jgi:hypothetical protein
VPALNHWAGILRRSQQALSGLELLAQHHALGGDVELTQVLVVRAASSLEHGERALERGVPPQELQQDDIVGQVRDAVLGQPGDPEQLVASAEPAVVLASLAALCAPAVADECWATILQEGVILPIGTAASTGARPSAGEDRLTLSFRQSAWEHYPEFFGTMTWRWHDRDRPTRSDKVIARLLLDRAVELVRAQRLELAVAVERGKAANLQLALVSNREISQAIGILMSVWHTAG